MRTPEVILAEIRGAEAQAQAQGFPVNLSAQIGRLTELGESLAAIVAPAPAPAPAEPEGGGQ